LDKIDKQAEEVEKEGREKISLKRS